MNKTKIYETGGIFSRKRCSGRGLGIMTLAVVMLALPVGAADSVTYQGVLRDAGGDPVPDGVYQMDFAIYDAPSGGTALWSETQSVAVLDGAFSVELGLINPFGALFQDQAGAPLWLGVAVDTGTGMQIYDPRIPLTRAPYAFHAAKAEDANTLEGMSKTDIQAEIDSAVTAHDADNTAHADIRTKIADDIAAHDADNAAHADIRANITAMAVPIGTIIPIYTGLPGVPTLAQLRAQGWATCDGTTPASQGIPDAVMNLATPDLNNSQRFLRGGTIPGQVQGHSVGPHDHPTTWNLSTSDAGTHTHAITASTDSTGAHTHSVTGTTAEAGNHQHAETGSHINDALYITGVGAGPSTPKNNFSGPYHGANQYTQYAGNHSHSLSGTAASAGAHTHPVTASASSAGGHTHSISGNINVNNNTGTTETRPVNMSMVFFIKVK